MTYDDAISVPQTPASAEPPKAKSVMRPGDRARPEAVALERLADKVCGCGCA